MSLLQRSSFRYLIRHPWLIGLSVLGVAIGVAVVVSIDLANTSAERAFQLSAETVTGKATHQVVGTAGPLEDDVYRTLRIEAGIRPSAPVVEGYASLERGDRTFQVVGIDPFTDSGFRPYLGTGPSGNLDLSTFMTQDAALLSAPTASELDLSPGDSLQVDIEGTQHSVLLVGLITPEDERSRRAVANVVVVDVSTAQHLFDMRGQLSHIDLILPSADSARDAALNRIRSSLPEGAQIQRSETRTETVEQMTQAFELNLTALSLLALVVGAFLIYNTMTFTVVQRRPLIGRLRALGVTKRQIFQLVLTEAILIGGVGTAGGLLLGIVLASGLVQILAQTINDLYYVVEVSRLSITPWTLVKGSLLGVGTTLLATLPPAREATNAPVSTVLQRSIQETNVQALAPRLAGIGTGLGILGAVLVVGTEESLLVSYVAVLCLLGAAALLTPLAVMTISMALRPVMNALFGVIGRMAARGVVTSLSRTGVAIAALMIAVATTVGVGLMIDSFRGTVEDWLTQSLQADIYVQAPSEVFRRSTATLDPAVADTLRSVEGIRGAHTIRRVSVQSDVGPTALVAVEPGPETADVYRFKAGVPSKIWPEFRRDGTVFVSEPYAYRHDLAVGDTLRLETDRGPQPFPVRGIYYDYASEQGVVMMSRSTYRQFYNDPGISGIAFYAESGQNVDALIGEMREAVSGLQAVLIRSNQALRQTSLNVFDRAFTITTVLRILAIVVAFIGVLSALMALELERRREFGVLRATGMTPPQLWGYVTLQTGLMGAISGVLALPLGYGLAYILVFVINKRSFGWTLQLSVSPEILGQAFALAVGAALIAGLYPAWKMAQSPPALALREE